MLYVVISMAKPVKNKLNITSYEKKFLLEKYNISNIEELNIEILLKLKKEIKKVKDPRNKLKRCYKIWDIIICVFLANLSGAETWKDIELFVKNNYDFLKTFLKMTGGIPNYQTYERVFSLINYKKLEKILVKFFINNTKFISPDNDIISLDGKTSNSSNRNKTENNEEIKSLNVLNAYSHNYGICIGSQMIGDKTNEIPNIPVILKSLNIKNTVVTWDALNTQIKNCNAVVKGGGDFLVPVKKNQKNFFVDLELFFDEKQEEIIITGKPNTAYKKTHEKSNSSIITYEYFQVNSVDWYFKIKEWPSVKTFGYIKKTIEKNGIITVEKHYYISSLFMDIDLFAKCTRAHWGVENNVHWHLDFTFRDDYNTTANKNALLNLQIIRKFSIAILNKVKNRYTRFSLNNIKTNLGYNFSKNFVELVTYLSLS